MGVSKGYVSSPMATHLYPHLLNFKANILINNNGCACLADFSSFTIAGDQLMDTPSSTLDGMLRWMSPELMDPERFGLEDDHPTKESDCYALGMVIYEVLSRNQPFAPYSEYATVARILRGKRPKRPRGVERILFTDNIWGMLKLCWKPQPRDRISASAVLLRLEEHPPLLMPSPNVDGNAETDGNDSWDDQTEPSTDGELESSTDEESESGSDDEWHSAESDCTFSPFRPGLMFDSPCIV
jgi:hypothetical protein